jgi:hypothetical protein
MSVTVSATGEQLSGAIPPPPARLARRRLRLVLRVAAWCAAVLCGFAALGFFLYTRRVDVRGARQSARQELAMMLEPGERVEQVAFVAQRRWWDYFRETHGVLAATDRRLLFVGVPPKEVMSPESGPQVFEQRSFPYDRPLRVERGRVFVGTSPGMVLRGGAAKETFAVAAADRPGVDSVLAVVGRVQTAMREAAERERRAQIYASWIARQPLYHRVERGEALISIAVKYGVTPEQIRAWNGLGSDVVKAGQRLLVKPRT